MNKFLSALSLTLMLVFYSNNSVAQSMSAGNYKIIMDSLRSARLNHIADKEKLESQIDSLKISSENLDDLITAILDDINKLYVKKFGKEKANRIINKQIWKGMTDKMLLASWGKPDKIEKNVEKWGTFTQWYYGSVTFFFKNGKLTDWEESQ